MKKKKQLIVFFLIFLMKIILTITLSPHVNATKTKMRTINAYSLLSHEWWVPLIKFIVGPTIYVREGSIHL